MHRVEVTERGAHRAVACVFYTEEPAMVAALAAHASATVRWADGPHTFDWAVERKPDGFLPEPYTRAREREGYLGLLRGGLHDQLNRIEGCLRSWR